VKTSQSRPAGDTVQLDLLNKCCCPLIPLAVSIDDASGKIAVKHVQKGIDAKSPRWTMETATIA
jgi:hypothetical protein